MARSRIYTNLVRVSVANKPKPKQRRLHIVSNKHTIVTVVSNSRSIESKRTTGVAILTISAVVVSNSCNSNDVDVAKDEAS